MQGRSRRPPHTRTHAVHSQENAPPKRSTWALRCRRCCPKKSTRSTAASGLGCTDEPIPTRRHALPQAGERQYSLPVPLNCLTRMGIHSLPHRRLAQWLRMVVLSPICAAGLPAPLPCTSAGKRGPRQKRQMRRGVLRQQAVQICVYPCVPSASLDRAKKDFTS